MSEREIHPLQAMVDGWSQRWQQERAASQMTLGELIETLERLPLGDDISGFGLPHSYRGYYRDLAFEPDDEIQAVADLLATCKTECMGRTFTGYKGGDFVMGERTPLWIAPYGSCGDRLMALDIDGDPIRPVTEPEPPFEP